MQAQPHVRNPVRADIQVLRALAVMLVVLFHLWPGIAASGFIGVDIFFVISGFLITGHLLNEVDRTGTISLGRFWLRRARRLLPAAFLVIFATSVLVITFVPKAFWDAFAQQAFASTFYFENFVLTFDAVDYLNSQAPPTAVQQFWSLSVEEQFYILWPLLILGALLVARKFALKPHRVIFWILGITSVASLVFSIVLVTQNDPAAYFSTFSRAWEFGLGGLAAILAAGGKLTWHRLQSLTGIALLIASIALITPASPFPGAVALLPAMGTALILTGGSNRGGEPRWTALPGVGVTVWLGSISYAMYLWHWPLVILFPHVFGSEPTSLQKILIFGLTVALAWLTFRFVENPLRRGTIFASRPLWQRLAIGVLAALIAVLPSAGASVYGHLIIAAESEARSQLVGERCFGTESIDNVAGCLEKEWSITTPAPALASQDLSSLYDNNHACMSDTTEVITCHFGRDDAPRRAVLIGDSHAAQWFPALEKIALENDVQLDVMIRFSCAFTLAPRGKDFADCEIWSAGVAAQLASDKRYDFIFLSSWAKNLSGDVTAGSLSHAQALDGFRAAWGPLIERGSQIVVLRDVPTLTESPSRCLEQYPQTMMSCATDRSVALAAPDIQFEAARETEGVGAVDLTNYFCQETVCFTMVGGVVVYLDDSHITQTYAKVLATPLAQSLSASLGIALR